MSSSSSFHIEVPSVDKRVYKHLTLSSANTGATTSSGMDVLLISDPDADKASGAIDVHVGQLCDGNSPGIAHFCEHMLFIGTEKYPTENAYDQYLNTNGGSSNAFTDLEHTCYYFDVQPDSLEGALDRFAQCFIGPLFTQSALEREIQAVDSEHGKNLQQETWRMYQLTKSRMVQDSTHPFGGFGSGNQKSLPIVDIREKLLAFYQTHYRQSLSLYKLVVLGKESMEELEAMVNRIFIDLVQQFDDDTSKTTTTATTTTEEEDVTPPPSLDRKVILQQLYPTLLDQLKLPSRLHVVPIPQTHSVELQFPLRELQSLYQSKPTRYLSHLIGHEGKGSLLSLLKSLHYAQELYADDASKSCQAWSIFTLKIDLTKTGLDHINDVVHMVFAYLDLLRTTGPQEWVQQELQTVAELQFRFLSQRNPMDYACSIAGWMQNFPPHHYLSGPYKVWEFQPDAVMECLSFLRPDNVMVAVSSPTFVGTTSHTEPWYGTEYEPVELEEAVLHSWATAKHTSYPELQLPEPNDMIATDFELKSSSDTLPKNQPQCILNLTAPVSKADEEEKEAGGVGTTNGSNSFSCRLWYKPDNVFEMPKVNMLFHIHTRSYESPETHVMTQLWSELLQEQCIEFTYLASMAGLHCDSANTVTGVELQVSGYHHKAHVLLQRIVDTVFDKYEVSQELFDRVQTKIAEQYQCYLVAQPYQHAMDGADQCLEYVHWSIEDKMDALERITLEDLLMYVKRRLFQQCSLEGLVHGNLSPVEAQQLADIILTKLQPTPDPHPLENRVIELAPQPLSSPGSSTSSSYLYQFPEFNESNTNSCFQMLLQIGPMEYAENAVLVFFNHLVREPAFNQLRTEEQLGYIVHTSIKTSGNDIKGLLFLIQSDSFDPIHMEERVELFLSKFRQKYILPLTEDEFQKNKDAVVANFLEKVRWGQRCFICGFLCYVQYFCVLQICAFSFSLSKSFTSDHQRHTQSKNLGEESSRYWHVILNQTYAFTKLHDIAEHVKTLTKERVLRFFDKYVAVNAPCRRKLCTHVFANQHAQRMGQKATVDGVDPDKTVIIEDPVEFKRTMPLFPLAKRKQVSVVSIPQNDKE
jgi:insulysin